MKLSTKIAASMGSLAVLMGVLGVYLIMQMAKVNDVSSLMAARLIPSLANADAMNNAASEYRMAEILHIYSTDAANMREYETRQGKWEGVIAGSIKKLDGLLISPQAKQAFQGYLTARETYRAVNRKVLGLSRENHTEEALALMFGESRTAYDKMSESLNNLIAAVNNTIARVNAEGDDAYADSRLLGICLVVAAVLIAVILTLLLVRNTLRQLGKDPGELNNIARRVVDGDYNVDDGGKKMGVYGSIVEMVNALKTHIDNAQHESENAKEQSRKAREAMTQAEAASKEARTKTEAMLVAADKLEQVGGVVSSASTQLSAQIEQSDRGAAESAQRLSEAATAMNEMNATVQEVAKNAGSASNASAETKQKAEAGAQVVEKTVRNIEAVHQVSLELKQDMVQLNEHAQDITRIMGVISDIADRPTCWPLTPPLKRPARARPDAASP